MLAWTEPSSHPAALRLPMAPATMMDELPDAPRWRDWILPTGPGVADRPGSRLATCCVTITGPSEPQMFHVPYQVAHGGGAQRQAVLKPASRVKVSKKKLPATWRVPSVAAGSCRHSSSPRSTYRSCPRIDAGRDYVAHIERLDVSELQGVQESLTLADPRLQSKLCCRTVTGPTEPRMSQVELLMPPAM